eukprot:m.343054 g.343054  ORF g.343054 m.343054 type:complete len:375 (-) comp20625_c0_seq1:56-1180(-)
MEPCEFSWLLLCAKAMGRNWRQYSAVLVPHLRYIDVFFLQSFLPLSVLMRWGAASHRDSVVTSGDIYASTDYAEALSVVSRLFPKLHALHVAGNKTTTLTRDDGTHGFPPCLKLLNLEDNLLRSWNDVRALGDLETLENLNIAKNGISSITMQGGDAVFTRLRVLNISRNNLTSWTSVSELSRLPALEELIIAHNPLFDGEKGLHVRQSIIARLPKLRRLNKSDVTEQERIIAERFYLATYAKEFWAVKGAPEDPTAAISFQTEHPTYGLLVSKHGEPEQPKAVTVALKDGFVRIHATKVSGGDVQIQLPKTTTVARLRQGTRVSLGTTTSVHHKSIAVHTLLSLMSACEFSHALVVFKSYRLCMPLTYVKPLR